jgi:hypothetical protein
MKQLPKPLDISLGRIEFMGQVGAGPMAPLASRRSDFRDYGEPTNRLTTAENPRRFLGKRVRLKA